MENEGDIERMIDQEVKLHEDIIKKKTKVQQSRDQLMIRFPKQIRELMSIKKGDVFEFQFNTKNKSYKIIKK